MGIGRDNEVKVERQRKCEDEQIYNGIIYDIHLNLLQGFKPSAHSLMLLPAMLLSENPRTLTLSEF